MAAPKICSGALPPYKATARPYKTKHSEYRKYLVSNEVKSALTVTDDQVSDPNTFQAMVKSVQTAKPVSGRWAGTKRDLTGYASTSELKKAAGPLSDQTSKLKSKLKVPKADVLAVATSQTQ